MSLPSPAPAALPGYLDAVGGQPMLPVARETWLAAAGAGWSDPARLHHEGRQAGMLLDAARASLATSLGVLATEVFVTTSGPSAVGVAVGGLVQARPKGARRVVAAATESLAVLSAAQGFADQVDLVPVDGVGRVDVGAFADLLTAAGPTAAVACLQVANPEVGTVQPITEVTALARSVGVPMLVHAVQAVGRIEIPPDWDVLCTSARDWGGPAGVGLIAIRPHVRWRPEENPDRGWVSGFPDIPATVAAARALEYLREVWAPEASRHLALTATLRERLPDVAPGVIVTGPDTGRLPHVVTFTCADITGEVVVDRLSRLGFSVASGSACTSDVRMPSQVLAAMGIAADASVRVSLPFGCPDDIVDRFLTALPEALASARDA